MLQEPVGILGATPLAAALLERLSREQSGRIIVHSLAAARPSACNLRIEQAANAFDLAMECRLILSACASRQELDTLLTGTDERPGLMPALQPGTLVVDFTPGLAIDAMRLAGRLGQGAVGLVEVGVLGGREAVAAGSARLLAGGFQQHIVRVTPVLERFGSVMRAGAQGHGRILAGLVSVLERVRREANEVANAIDCDPAALALFMPPEGGIQHEQALEADASALVAALSRAGLNAPAIGEY